MKMIHLTLTAGAFLAPLMPCFADPQPFIHYVAGEKLSDVALIDRAGHEIDMAAYELRDSTIIQALTRAADRGVKAHIYLDGVLADSKPSKAFNDLAKRPGVEIRAKHDGNTLMHLSSYQIDGHMVRTDNLDVIESAEAATAFKRVFDEQCTNGKTLSLGVK